jgi:hypothetical protein
VARITFTQNLDRHVQCPPEAVSGSTLREALAAYFALHPATERYVVDEQGALRKHVVVFLDGRQLGDRARLSDPVADDCEIYVMQALSGG